MNPMDLKYTRTHEWVRIEGDVATVGITDFAVQQLTDLVYIDLPEVGRALDVQDAFGEVESVKAVSDLYAPVAGEVVEVNSQLEGNLAVLSEDPFGKGWMVKLRITDPSTLEGLLDRAEYEAHIAAEE